MHEKITLKEKGIYSKIRQLSNVRKFKILELTQEREVDVTELSKLSLLAFNKCSNYCTSLEKENLIKKEKKGKNTFVKSKISLKDLKKVL